MRALPLLLTALLACGDDEDVLGVDAAVVDAAVVDALVADAPVALCGNGAPDPGEVCDDGNTMGGDGCRADCLGNEDCGDGFVDVGEYCIGGLASALGPTTPGE